MLANATAHRSTDPRKGLETEVFVRAVAERVAHSSGLELVDVELKRGGKGPLVRIYLDKPGRVTLDDLENASREISAILDVEDPVGRSYTLEVSSPGTTRPLKTPRDFERAIEKNIQIAFEHSAGETAAPAGETGSRTLVQNASVKEVRGRVLAVNDKEVRIAPRDNKGREGAEIAVPLSAVRHAQREISFR